MWVFSRHGGSNKTKKDNKTINCLKSMKYSLLEAVIFFPQFDPTGYDVLCLNFTVFFYEVHTSVFTILFPVLCVRVNS